MTTDAFNIFDELTQWAQTLETWQQCALAKLVALSELSEADYREIFAEFMIEKKLWPQKTEKTNIC